MRARLVFVLLLLGLALLARTAGAGEATDQLRADIDELYRSVNATATPPSSAARAAARPIVDRMFDWAAMAEASLRGYWPKRTPAERAEFTRLFSDVFARAYLSRIHLVDARNFQYLGDTTAGDRGTVKTTILTNRGSTLDVDYLVQASPARRWLVQDVRVEGISLIDNYRVQFDSIIGKSSYEELVNRLRTVATR